MLGAALRADPEAGKASKAAMEERIAASSLDSSAALRADPEAENASKAAMEERIAAFLARFLCRAPRGS